LLADRDDDSRAMYAEFLTFEGWGVEAAADGRETFTKAIATQPDVIVTGTHLTGLSGYELCDRLRQDKSTRAIPIIVVTTDVAPADMERARAAGADSVLIKPCLPETLAREAARLFGEAAIGRKDRDRSQTLGVAERPERFKRASKPPLSTDLA
jgi:CheY-like chemotaxis protein